MSKKRMRCLSCGSDKGTIEWTEKRRIAEVYLLTAPSAAAKWKTDPEYAERYFPGTDRPTIIGVEALLSLWAPDATHQEVIGGRKDDGSNWLYNVKPFDWSEETK